ncbi:MAG: cell division protein FtsZ, partial [Chloroflexi bacterium]|nr:cell division protein FtsZ [Chloroflexota bacterium]
VDPEANIIFGVILDPNMGNEVRLTLIATGFASKQAMAGATREKEITKLLKGIKSDDELEVPSFLRQQHAFGRPRVSIPSPSRNLYR